MHEFTITSAIVEALFDLADKQGSKRVLEVYLSIGKLRSLSSEQVRFSYGILTKGTILQGSKLIIEETDARIRCIKCGYMGQLDPRDDLGYHFAIPSLLCPQCQNPLSIEGGDECVITKVRMELPSPTLEGNSAAKEGTEAVG
jgi:hydrogenase nickel incorporation protein HypA/HybF